MTQPHHCVDLHELVKSTWLSDTNVVSVIGRVRAFKITDNLLELACVMPSCTDLNCFIIIDASMVEPILMVPGHLVKIFAERTSTDAPKTFKATIIKSLEGMDMVAFGKVFKARKDYFGERIQRKISS